MSIKNYAHGLGKYETFIIFLNYKLSNRAYRTIHCKTYNMVQHNTTHQYITLNNTPVGMFKDTPTASRQGGKTSSIIILT